MTAARRHLLIALLLPVLALRVLLPAGFMPVAEAGELRIVMCAEGLQLPAGDSGHPASDKGGNCPFAHASFNAPPMQPAMRIALAAPQFHFVALLDATLPAATGPPRSATARAPPALS